jgi:hypothetical protein
MPRLETAQPLESRSATLRSPLETARTAQDPCIGIAPESQAASGWLYVSSKASRSNSRPSADEHRTTLSSLERRPLRTGDLGRACDKPSTAWSAAVPAPCPERRDAISRTPSLRIANVVTWPRSDQPAALDSRTDRRFCPRFYCRRQVVLCGLGHVADAGTDDTDVVRRMRDEWSGKGGVSGRWGPLKVPTSLTAE